MSRRANPREPSRRLLNIFSCDKIQTLFVIVPGIGMRAPADWRDDTGRSWLQAIPSAIAPGLAVFAYQHGMTTSDSFSWQVLLGQGEELLSCLLQLIEDEKLESCPIVLIGHSVGGLILKEALRSAYEQYVNFRLFLHTLAGAILLGTPHSTAEDCPSWQNAALLLQTGVALRKRRNIDREDIETLVRSSTRFEEANVTVPILSVYEVQETKIRTQLVSTKRILLVEERFAQTKAKNEQIIGLNTDHRGLCKIVVGDKDFEIMCTFILTALEDARLRIVNGSPEYEVPAALDQWTIFDNDEISPLNPKDQDRAEDSSNPTNSSDPQTQHATAGTSDLGFEVIPLISDFTSTRRGPKLPCHMMPLARNRDFYGRTEILQKLDDAFFPRGKEWSGGATDTETNQIKTFALCGPGGMGKTQTAAEFVLSRKDCFDAIFWIYADQAAKLADGFGQIALQLGLIGEDSVDMRDQVVTRELAKGWLANPLKSSNGLDVDATNQARWLLVFDNADDPEVLNDFWPLDGPGCVLFTSRDPLARDSTYLATAGVVLDPFSIDEASEFLTRLTKKEGDGRGVAEKLGGLPLAMTQMAGIIVRRDLTYSEFLKTYDEEESHEELFKLRLDQRNRRSGYEHTLASVWALESLKHGVSLLDVLSLLDPDGILERILTTHPESASIETFPRTSIAYQRARTELLQSSLIVRDKTAQKILIHRLIQDAARTKMSPTRFQMTFSTALALLSSVWPFEAFSWRHGVARWRVCEELFPHVIRLKRFATMVKRSKETFSTDLELAKLLTDAGWFYHENGNSIDSASFFETAQVIVEALQKSLTEQPLHPDMAHFRKELASILAEIHHNSGCIGTETNNPTETLKHFKIFNEMMINEINDDAPGKDMRLAISWNELGNAYMMNKMWSKGEECFLKSMNAMQRLDSFSRTDMSFPFVNLGLAYWLMGRLEEAFQTLLEGLKDREAAFGIDDKESFITGRFFHALGNVTAAQGLLDESFSYHRRALVQYKSTIGNSHHRTGDVHIKVADHYSRLGQEKDAVAHLNQALRIFGDRAIYKPEKARAKFKKSVSLVPLQRLDEANAELKESYRLYCELMPENRRSMESLSQDDFDEIIAFWSR